MMIRPAGHRAEALRAQGALALLRHAHAHPGITRAEAAAQLGLSSGSATEIMNRLRAAKLLGEAAAPQTGGRGRPTTTLVPHPQGPLVAVVDITHTTWTVSTAAVGGAIAPAPAHRHLGQPAEQVLPAIRQALDHLAGDRLRAVGVAIPGTLHGHTLIDAANLRWHDIDLSILARKDLPLVVGNDASLAGVGEALRGAGRGMPVALHLTVEVGIGGVLLLDGRPVLGALGAGGEFGHVPFGDPALRCPCGASGCWDLMVDGRAMARHQGRRAPADPTAYAVRTLGEARDGEPGALAAVAGVAEALGRGIGALVNAFDPAIVTLGGLGADVLAVAEKPFTAAVRRAAMAWRRDALPPIVAATLGSAGPAVGAAETAMAEVLNEHALESQVR